MQRGREARITSQELCSYSPFSDFLREENMAEMLKVLGVCLQRPLSLATQMST